MPGSAENHEHSDRVERLSERIERLTDDRRDDKERIDRVLRDLEMQGKSIGEIVLFQRGLADDLAQVQQEGAVRAERDRHRDKSADRSWQILVLTIGAFISVTAGAVLWFVFRGGLNNVP